MIIHFDINLRTIYTGNLEELISQNIWGKEQGYKGFPDWALLAMINEKLLRNEYDYND